MNKLITSLCLVGSFVAGIGANHLFFQSNAKSSLSAATSMESNMESNLASGSTCNIDALNSQGNMAKLAEVLRQTVQEGLREEAVALMLEASLNPRNDNIHHDQNSERAKLVKNNSINKQTEDTASLAESQSQQRMATEQFQQLVSSSINSAQWSERDNNQLRQLLGTIDQESEQRLMTELAAAINRGELDIQFDGPLF